MPEAGVTAAGGVIVRRGPDGPEVAIVHRPRYDDWSLPKGKLEHGESFEEAALREVREETGLKCQLGPELEPSRYQDAKGRAKLVRWWLMRPAGGVLAPDHEIDDTRWVSPGQAAEMLDYDADRKLVARALALTGGEKG